MLSLVCFGVKESKSTTKVLPDVHSIKHFAVEFTYFFSENENPRILTFKVFYSPYTIYVKIYKILDDIGIPFNYVQSCSVIIVAMMMRVYLSVKPVNITRKGRGK